MAASAATTVSVLATAANRLGAVSVSTLASSPQGLADGRVWLLVTSGLLADRPAVASLVGFWLVGFAALAVCTVRVAVGAALAGHVLSALVVYGIVGLARLVDPHAFASVVQLADYGLSAMIAAWLGAIASVFWSRYPGKLSRLLVTLGSVGCVGIGLALRPDVTFLDSEHLVAFAIGVTLASPAFRARFAPAPGRLVAATANILVSSRGA